ncbi:MAG: hypothetical protein UHD09_03545 [Bifidobacterium sp.]|nr:hypothetical protein [Bifidobacterium sp.]
MTSSNTEGPLPVSPAPLPPDGKPTKKWYTQWWIWVVVGVVVVCLITGIVAGIGQLRASHDAVHTAASASPSATSSATATASPSGSADVQSADDPAQVKEALGKAASTDCEYLSGLDTEATVECTVEGTTMNVVATLPNDDSRQTMVTERKEEIAGTIWSYLSDRYDIKDFSVHITAKLANGTVLVDTSADSAQ